MEEFDRESNKPEIDVSRHMRAGEALGKIFSDIRYFFSVKPGIVVLSSIVLLMLWGYHGDLDLLRFFIRYWNFPCEAGCERIPLIPGLPWDRELISFWGGALLLVVIPCCIILFGFRQPLGNYGLSFPYKEKRKAAWMTFAVFLVLGCISMLIAARDKEMQDLYPFYKNFHSVPEFFLYELCYFPFFLVIEFVFRGYLLFGIADNPIAPYNEKENTSPVYLRAFAIILSMLAYNTWHLGKPLTELWATPVWGLAAGSVTYALRSIWPVLMVHFLMNVLLDAMVLHHLRLLFY